MIEVKAGPVLNPTSIKLIIFHGGADQDLLHIAVSEVRICLQHEGHHSGHSWRRRRSPAKGIRVRGIREIRELRPALTIVVTHISAAVRRGDALFSTARRRTD